MMQFLTQHGLDLLTTFLGIIYLVLEYRASTWLWIVGIIMPLLDVWLYATHGLYGDAGMAVYYTLAAIYGLVVWRFGRKRGQAAHQPMPITHMKRRHYLPLCVFFLLAWGITYWLLCTQTNSTVPALDAFTNALSFIGLWALARKYIEQWWAWLIVDFISTYLYLTKGIPFKAGLYALYTAMAIAGYYKWKRMMQQQHDTLS